MEAVFEGVFLDAEGLGCTAIAAAAAVTSAIQIWIERFTSWCCLPYVLIVAAYIRYSHPAEPRTEAPLRSWPRLAWDECNQRPPGEVQGQRHARRDDPWAAHGLEGVEECHTSFIGHCASIFTRRGSA